MAKGKKAVIVKKELIFLRKATLIALFLFVALFFGLRFFLSPDAQYRFRQWWVMRKDPIAGKYFQNKSISPISLSDLEKSGKVSTRSIYAFSLGDGTLTQLYAKTANDWSPHLQFDQGAIYFSDTKNIYRLRVTDTKPELLFSESNLSRSIDRVTGIAGTTVYFTEYDPGNTNPASYEFKALTLGTGIIRSLYTVPTSFFAAPTDVWETNGRLYTMISGGDGCGGGSSISEVKDGKSTTIESYGEGCAGGPRLISVLPDGNRVLAAEVLPEDKQIPSSDSPIDYCKFDVLYYLHLDTGKKEPLFDMKPLNECIWQRTYSPVSNQLVMASERTLYVLDMATFTMKKYPIEESLDWQSKLFANKFLMTFANKAAIGVLDVDTGKTDIFHVEAKYFNSGSVQFLGIRDNTAYIETTDYR
jgi:hypothetical protein